MMNTRICMAVAVIAIAQGAAYAPARAQTPPVKVVAWGHHHGGRVIYRYDVQNSGVQPIRRFIIGLDAPEAGEGGAELTVAPTGPATSLWLSEEVASRPAGWGVGIVYPEHSAKFSLEWIEAGYFKRLWPLAPATENAPAVGAGDQAIRSGGSVAVSVAIDRMDPAYVNGHATADLGDRLVSVRMVKGDTLPPTIRLTSARLNQNESRGEWALFNVRAEITDNFDPSPLVNVSPVTSNHVLAVGDATLQKGTGAWNARFRNVPGRTYSFMVRAVDASGNVSTQAFLYSVEP